MARQKSCRPKVIIVISSFELLCYEGVLGNRSNMRAQNPGQGQTWKDEKPGEIMRIDGGRVRETK